LANRKQASLTDAVIAAAATAEQLAADAEVARLRAEVAALKGRYRSALAQIDRERERADAFVQLKGIEAKRPLTKSVKGKAPCDDGRAAL
jgi:hypothetical protein